MRARRRRCAVGVGGQIWRSLRGGGGQKREAVLLAAASAARQQGCRTVGSQSVNLTLNVNVSGGRTPGTPPDAAPRDATDGTDGGKHGNNTNNAVDWFDS